MKEVVNQWNINMNTVGMAEVEQDKKQTVWGFSVRSGKQLECKVSLDENKCILAWYNARCEIDTQVSDIYSCDVMQNEVTQEQIHAFKEELKVHPIDIDSEIISSISLPVKEEYISESLIWNAVAYGEEENRIPEEEINKYGYGLLYWESNEVKTFFDNRLAKTYAKMMELHRVGIKPLWIRIEKQNNRPIPVRQGREAVEKIGATEEVRECYDYMQDM